MSPRRRLRLVGAALVVGLMSATLVPLPAPSASANPAGFREVVAALRLFSAANARARAYREARDLQQDMDAHYAHLRDTARRLLLDREVTRFSENQLVAYWKLVEQIDGERNAATRLIEGEKRTARAQFNRTLRRELLGAMIRSPFGTRVTGDVRRVLSETRGVVAELRAAIERGDPAEALLAALEERVAGIGPVRRIVRTVGGTSGAGLLLQLGRAGDLLRNVTEAARAGQAFAADAEGVLAEIDRGLEREIDRARRTRSGAALGSVLDELLVAAVDEPSVEAVVHAVETRLRRDLAALLGQSPGGLSERQSATMRQRVRGELLDDIKRRIAELPGRHVECEKVTGSRFREFVDVLDNPEALARLATDVSVEGDRLYLLCVTADKDEIQAAVLLALGEDGRRGAGGESDGDLAAMQVTGTWEMYTIGSDGVERHAYTLVLTGSDISGMVDVVQDVTDRGTYEVEGGQIRVEFTRTLDLTNFGPWDEASEFTGVMVDETTIEGEYVRQGWSCLPDRDPPCAYDNDPAVFESRLARRP